MSFFPLLRGFSLGLAASLLAAGVVLHLTGAARADVVILKDGHILHGKVKRESQVVVDTGGTPIEMPKMFFLVDDGVRRVIFSSRQVEDVEPGDSQGETDVVQLTRQVIPLAAFNVPSPLLVESIAPWNAKWERTVKIRGPNTAAAVEQRISVLNPYYLRADSLRYRWPVLYLTREYDPATLRGLLVEHPDLKMKGDADDALKRFRIFRFFLQSGALDQADAELTGIARDLPGEKEKVQTAREQVRKLRLIEVLNEVQRAHDAGRGRWVQDVLAALADQPLDEKQQARVRALRSEYETGRDRLGLAWRMLSETPPLIDETPKREAFTQAASVILAELTAENAARLDAFTSLAQQAERDQQQKRKPTHAPDQLMALAVSGWLLGNSAADTRVDTALRLWRARQFLLDYLRTHGAVERRQKLQAYQKAAGPAGVDEFAQMLRQLPPPEQSGTGGMERAAWLHAASSALLAPAHNWVTLACLPPPVPYLTRPTVLKFQADVPWSQRRGATYWVQLPPEYQPGRHYPVLVALHHSSEGAEDILKRLGPLAALRGYVLVTPTWMRPGKNTYEFTPEEHAAVTDVLWEVRRRFAVDTDRVFLTGFGDGAYMAFDVGLSHPDLFAGVVPIGGCVRYFSRAYKYNGQYLPFYVVEGDRNGKSPLDLREHYKHWVPRGYPALYVEYKGRAFEWFAAELPHAFDWMARQKRAAALPELGRGGGTILAEGYTSMRPTDNRFYWMTGEGLAENQQNEAGRWRPILGGMLSARIQDGTAINVSSRGFKRVTVWLGPGMLDFDKPVLVRVNGAAAGKRAVKPSLDVLLEDLYQRGDRQRAYWAKLEIVM